MGRARAMPSKRVRRSGGGSSAPKNRTGPDRHADLVAAMDRARHPRQDGCQMPVDMGRVLRFVPTDRYTSSTAGKPHAANSSGSTNVVSSTMRPSASSDSTVRQTAW